MQQQHRDHHAGMNGGQDSCKGLFGYGPSKQISSRLGSNHIFPELVSPNRPDMSLNSRPLDAQPSNFV